jgi:hypothetical protein
MARIKIYKEEVPVNRPCHVWIENKYKLIEKMSHLVPKFNGKQMIRMNIDFDVDKLLDGVNKATDKHKWWGWINKNTNTDRTEHDKIRRENEGIDYLNRGSYYGGWSIKNNPVYSTANGLQPESSGMGEMPSPLSWFIFSNLGREIYKNLEESQQLLPLTRMAVEQGYKQVIDTLVKIKLITIEQALQIEFPKDEKLSKYHKEKDAYFDTWSFTEWTQAAIESGIKDVTESANCQVLRSRVAWQRGEFRDYRIKDNDYESGNDLWTWHSDEPIVHNTRVVIPIQTTKAFAMEIGDNGPRIPEKGYAYTWDTNTVHRQIQLDNTDKSDRIYIILGFNPWFNWVAEEQAWESNEFYGKIHPLDMMLEGLILPNVKFDEVIY